MNLMVSFNRDKSEIIPVDLWDTEKYPIDEEDRIFKNIILCALQGYLVGIFGERKGLYKRFIIQ